MSADNGGAAFPVLEKFQQYDDDKGCYRDVYQPFGGMTLRDYFAAQSIHAAENLVVYYSDKMRNEPTHIAKLAYDIADALLKEREKKA